MNTLSRHLPTPSMLMILKNRQELKAGELATLVTIKDRRHTIAFNRLIQTFLEERQIHRIAHPFANINE